MASKFQFITELYSRTLTRLTGDYESWTGFLRSACYNYKCPFDEQVLIYAQRPDATAVLELEKWNRQFGRWVNAGATGIAVMDEAHGKGRLKHYFDITDTHATRISRPVPIWTMEPAYTEPVIETLEATFGTLAEKDNLPDAILSASRNAVADNMQDYGPLIRALGGEVITISASNGSYVNALDISKEYGDGRNPLVLKSEFIMSLCEQLMGAGEIGAKEKSIIDRCTANIYRKYIRKYEGDPPTLKDLYDDLMRQKEPVAHEIALALELFTTGSLNVFAHQTNIDTFNRITCYDIQDLGENLKPIGLLVMLDSIINRVIRNRQQGRYTHVYIDEIYLFFASPGVGGKSAINNYSSEFLYKCWKRFRKYYATLTGITQNVEECLLSDTARLMFANSEFLVLLNQAPTDRAELAKLLGASDTQMDYVSDAPAGHGLIKVGSCLVPFINELPRDTELYRLMTTKPGEQNA